MFPNITFKTFKRLQERDIERSVEKWGIDSILYDHAKKIGKFLIIEDLSVYHIDNTYGQRKNNDCYFTDRKRWSRIDNEEVWCMQASKYIYPRFLERSAFDKIRSISATLEEFLSNCLVFARDKKMFGKKIIEKQKEKIIQEIKKPIYMKTMYKVTSPINFRSDPNIKHGESKLFAEVPKWANDNPRVVVERVEVKDETLENLINFEEQDEQDLKEIKTEEMSEDKTLENFDEIEERDEQNQEEPKTEESKKDEKGRVIRRCKKCNYTTTSLRRLKTHQNNKHS